MKNLIVSLSLVFATGLTPVLATGTNHDPRAEKTFAKQFAGAENVAWIQVDADYLKASFTLNGIRAEAYFSNDGELLGTARNLFYNQLPLLVMQTIGNKFTGAVIIEVTEITSPDGTNYKIVLEQNDRKYHLRVNGLGDIIEKKKEKLNK
jgi:hypothetical protein